MTAAAAQAACMLLPLGVYSRLCSLQGIHIRTVTPLANIPKRFSKQQQQQQHTYVTAAMQVRVELYDVRRTKFVEAHTTSLACLALSLDGKLLATASERGTLVRVFSTTDGSKLQVLALTQHLTLFNCSCSSSVVAVRISAKLSSPDNRTESKRTGLPHGSSSCSSALSYAGWASLWCCDVL
jgi:hypothetical protein